MQIRAAQPADLPTILAIYNHAVTTTTASFDLTEQTLAQRSDWFSQHNHDYPLLVADDDGQVVGYCSLSPFRAKPGYAKTVESSIYVDKHYRGQQIGFTLMTHILSQAATLGYHAVIAGVVGGNEASIRLHQKLGFELVGTLREVGLKFGAWQDVHYYEKILP